MVGSGLGGLWTRGAACCGPSFSVPRGIVVLPYRCRVGLWSFLIGAAGGPGQKKSVHRPGGNALISKVGAGLGVSDNDGSFLFGAAWACGPSLSVLREDPVERKQCTARGHSIFISIE